MFRCKPFTSIALVLTLVITPVGRLAAQEPATIKGKVVFKGDPEKHKPSPIAVPEDSPCRSSGLLKTEDVVLNLETKPVTVRNVVVSIKEGPIDVRYRWLQEPQLIVVENCRFEPHVTALLARLPIDVRSEDDIPHNVHFMAKVNRAHNFTIPRRGMQMSVLLDAEEPIEIKSDRYPWMKAWLAVFDHPYFLITEETGTFLFEGVPPGKYVLEAWHEKFGKQTLTVEVADGETKEVDFVYEPDKK